MGRAATIWAAMAGGLMASAAGAAPARSVLDQLQPGLWRIELERGPARTLCVGDPFALIQIEDEARTDCARRVIADGGAEATMSYDCPRAGWGRTSIRVVSATFVRLDAQGIAGNAPFAFSATGRRLGACPAAAVQRR